ncbi:MAG: hypothetical protein K6G30_08330, partial [Acetatifactor sp.]|nr:hypothetical protein [Acetatifactor sp.]
MKKTKAPFIIALFVLLMILGICSVYYYHKNQRVKSILQELQPQHVKLETFISYGGDDCCDYTDTIEVNGNTYA